MTTNSDEQTTAVVDTDSVDIAAEIKESRYVQWNHAVQNYVSVDLFRYVQFINRDEDVMFGSGIQKVVCKSCRVPENEQLEYWNTTGSEKVQEVMRRKRQTIGNSFRSQFESK
jgi:hypothetical protein